MKTTILAAIFISGILSVNANPPASNTNNTEIKISDNCPATVTANTEQITKQEYRTNTTNDSRNYDARTTVTPRDEAQRTYTTKAEEGRNNDNNKSYQSSPERIEVTCTPRE